MVNIPNSTGTIFGREPALVYGLIQAAIVLGVSFGLDLTLEQTGAILAFTTILVAVITRQSVVPTGKADEMVQEALYKPVPVQPELTVAQEPVTTIPVNAEKAAADASSANAAVVNSTAQGATKTLK